MIKFFKYFFYRIYTWNLKKWGKADLPQWNAVFGVSFMMFLNLGVLALLLQLIGINIFLREELPQTELIMIMLGLFFINYFLFIHKRKYLSISEEFKKESPEKRKRNTILIWLYVLLSFSLIILGAILIGQLNS